MTDVLPEMMQATGDQHDPVSEARFGVAEALFDDPQALDPGQDMLDSDADLPHQVVMRALRIRSLLTALFLDRLIDHHIHWHKALKPTVLIQFARWWEAEVRPFRNGFIVLGPWFRRTQERHLAYSEVDHDHVFKRVRFFLPLYGCRWITSSLERWMGRSVPSIAKV